MKSEWEEFKLSDHITVKHGFAFKGKHITTEATWNILLTPGNFNVGGGFKANKFKYYNSNDYPDEYVLQANDLIVTMTDLSKAGDTLGYPAKVPYSSTYRYLHNQRLGLVNLISNDLDIEYLYWLMRTKKYQKFIVNSATGSTVKHTSPSRILEYTFTAPSDTKKQKKIAHILSTLDDKIELNRKINDTLEAMAQALFKSWFVDFDPVHVKAGAKSEQGLEATAAKIGISKEILELFPSELEESEMGMIPKGWEVAKIEKILKRYRTPKRYKKDAVEKYGMTMVFEQGADIILGYHNDIGEFEATPDDPMFIFGDHTCVMRLSTKPFSISENVIPLSGSIRNGYWSYYATYGQQSFQEYRRHWAELIVKDIVLAPIDVCDYFAKKVQSFILKIEQNRLENNVLILMRDTLLPKLLSGELDVSKLLIETN
ncbi:MAG: restriction endonuclease subunit S [Sulfurimonas sp.]